MIRVSILIPLVLVACSAPSPASTTPNSTTPTTQPQATTASSEPLLDHLGPMEIKTGIDQLKSEVTACAGASEGDALPIKFWITGETGRVESFELLDHKTPQLEACVGQVIAAAEPGLFPRFRQDRQGFTFKFHFK